MSLPLERSHVENVCRLGQGAATCAFLTGGIAGLECAKGTSIEDLLRERRPSMTAQGDNCSGPPDYREAVPS